MKLNQLINGLDIKTINTTGSDITIHGIADNSSDIEEGFVFVAIRGFKSDGHEYIESAIKKGARLVVGEQPLPHLSVPYIQVRESRKALGTLAKNFYGNPSKHKTIIGVTGTNGKTTTSYILKYLLESNGKSCSVIGTIHNIINGEKTQSYNTTPSSLVLHKLLSLSNDDIVIMEVSSHGLSQSRLEGIEFDYCLFTNLHPEHLDYHSSMEEYFKAKLSLFNQLKTTGKAIVNQDNPWGQKLIKILQNKGVTVYSIGESENSCFQISSIDFKNSSAVIDENGETYTISSAMSGVHNLYNTLMAFATSKLAGICRDDLVTSIHGFKGVEGRFEIYKQLNGSVVVIDYAHTADAIAHCLMTVKQQGAQRITHVLGFRGNRDASKRMDMLSITADLSDQYILTFDDLNAVSPSEMVETLHYLHDNYGNEKGVVVSDRTEAIRQAMKNSSSGEWIVITGKGHEKYQQKYLLPTESDCDTVRFVAELK